MSISDRVKFEQVEETAKYILSNTKHRPEIAIVCGTGLGGIGELIKDGFSVSYETIPNFVSPRGQYTHEYSHVFLTTRSVDTRIHVFHSLVFWNFGVYQKCCLI